jgi:hypothetical protein
MGMKRLLESIGDSRKIQPPLVAVPLDRGGGHRLQGRQSGA